MSYAWCRFCSKPLSDESSTAVGYGPDCAADHNLPHGAAARRAVGEGQGDLFDIDPADGGVRWAASPASRRSGDRPVGAGGRTARPHPSGAGAST